MKKFKQLREKLNNFVLDEKNHLSYNMKDMKSAEFIKKELSGLVKADFEMKKKGSSYVLSISPKTSQDEKVIKSFMDDAKIDMLKDEFVRGIMKSNLTNEEISLVNSIGETVEISSGLSRKIVEIHDTLNRDNQELFMEMMVHSKDTFDQMVNFCESYAESRG